MASIILFAFLLMVSCTHIHAVWNVFFCREHGQTCTQNEDCCLGRTCTTISRPRVCLPEIHVSSITNAATSSTRQWIQWMTLVFAVCSLYINEL